MPVPAVCEAFWAAGRRANPALDRERLLEAFAFGDGEALAAELAGLVLQGVKRATASLAWTYEFENKPGPQAGDFSIVTSWTGEPLCIIETTTTEVVPFHAVTAQFARAEGEGDGTLESWRRNHAAFFGRECVRIGRIPGPGMPVVCERFRVVFPRAEEHRAP